MEDQYKKDFKEGKMKEDLRIIGWREAWERFLLQYYGMDFDELVKNGFSEKDMVEMIKRKYRPGKEMM